MCQRDGEVESDSKRLTGDTYDVIGYAMFFPKVSDYDLKNAPAAWAKIVAMRHAMTEFPDAPYLWYVDLDTFIMNPHVTIERDIMPVAKLEEMMILDHPVVPPNSIIHTFSHLRGEDIEFVITQDKDGLATSSFMMKNSEWSRFFLETWFDPIYRSYNFQKAEKHALVSNRSLPPLPHILSLHQYHITFFFLFEDIPSPANHMRAGTHCAMASYYPFQISTDTTTEDELVQQSKTRRGISNG